MMLVIMIKYLSAKEKVRPAIIPVWETKASCIPRTIAPGKSVFFVVIDMNYIFLNNSMHQEYCSSDSFNSTKLFTDHDKNVIIYTKYICIA